MQPPAVQQSLFKEIAAELPDQQKAEFFRNLHEAGIGPNDVELAKLLKVLQLYKAYYESIPTAVKEVAAEIKRISKDARDCSDASSLLAGQMIRESETFRQDVAMIHAHIQEALEQSAEALVAKTAVLLQTGIKESVLLPLQGHLTNLAASNQGFADAIAKSGQATEALHRNAELARNVHLGTYALAGLIIVCAAVLISGFCLNQWYAENLEQERNALIRQTSQNRTVLLELSKSHRTLELRQDAANPRRKLLVMKDASGWRSAGNHGVIEFNDK